MKEYLTPVGPTPLHVNPIFEIGPVEPRFSEWLVFEGISVDESGKQHFLDASVAYKRAVLNAIEYLSRFGYSKEQVGTRIINYNNVFWVVCRSISCESNIIKSS
jgi:formamidase